MILANVTFGSLRGKPREELEDAADAWEKTLPIEDQQRLRLPRNE
jgi:hypothetical protein